MEVAIDASTFLEHLEEERAGRNKPAGMCGTCGKHPPKLGFAMCESCRADAGLDGHQGKPARARMPLPRLKEIKDMKRWTPEETEFLRKNAASGAPVIAEKLSRTALSVRQKAQELGLPLNGGRGGWNARREPQGGGIVPPDEPNVSPEAPGVSPETPSIPEEAPIVPPTDDWPAPTDPPPVSHLAFWTPAGIEPGPAASSEPDKEEPPGLTAAEVEFLNALPKTEAELRSAPQRAARVQVELETLLRELGLSEEIRVGDFWIDRTPYLGRPPILTVVLEGGELPLVGRGEEIPLMDMAVHRNPPFSSEIKES